MAEQQTADVQAELQQYLNAKNINNLFIEIVEHLLIEKPDNPIAFIIEYLHKKYPEHAAESGTSRAPAVAEAVAAAPESDDETESDTDDEDDVGDLPEMPARGRPTGARRVSVSAESVNPNMTFEPKVIPKTDEEKQRIMEIIEQSVLLSHMDNSAQQKVMNAMFAVEKNDAERIIEQGEEGDNFYVLDTGSVDVFIRKGNDPEVKVASYGPGDAFGELAIMYNAPRAATCVATSPCKLWGLDRMTYKCIVMQASIQKRNQYRSFLENVPILQELNEYEVLTVADSLNEESFNAGTVICRQGDAGNTFYIVKEGVAVCTQTDANGNEVEVARLGQGAYFGEIALLTSKPRQATVTAEGDLHTLTLDRKTFRRVMGPLEDILKRSMEHYNKIQAQQI